MLDISQHDPAISPAWQEHIASGHVLAFRFPLAERKAKGAPKQRPCLVLDLQDVSGRPFALLAYGSTSQRNANSGWEIHATEDHAAYALDRPTRFIGRRRLLVSLDDPAFAICRATGSPVLGRLSGGPAERLQVVRARIQADSDARAERVAEARRAGRPAFVSLRRPRRFAERAGRHDAQLHP